MAYGKGWKRDAPGQEWSLARHRFGAPLNLARESLALIDYVLNVENQGDMNACVGYALGRAIHVRAQALKLNGTSDQPKPSYLSIYTEARRVEMHDPTEPLEDTGCAPFSAMQAIANIGVPKETTWPSDPEKVNVDLPWDDIQDAASFKISGWHRIDAEGPSLSAAMAQPLVQPVPIPVIFGLDLWAAFEDYSGGEIDSVGPDEKGGHMLCCLGFRTNQDGSRSFRVLNSWSASWGDKGWCWINERVLAAPRPDGSPRVSDVYAVEIHQ